MKQVTFNSGELELSGTLAIPKTAEQVPGVVLFHGLNSSVDSHAQLTQSLAANGIASLAVSMRGHGLSEGDFKTCTVGEALSDGLAAYDLLAIQEVIDGDRLGLFGSSAGAILAATTLAKRSVKSLALRAPAAYTSEMLKRTMADIKANQDHLFHQINNLPETPAGQALAAYSGHLLVITSEKDAMIPTKVTNGYIQIAGKAKHKELIVLQGAPHGLKGSPWKGMCNRIVCDWFADTLKV